MTQPFAPTKASPPVTPPGFDTSGGLFAPYNFAPKVALPPDQAPYKSGKAPAQQRAKATAAKENVRVTNPAPTPKIVQQGARTMALQRLLNASGAKLAVDGQWGPKTESAYQAYLTHMKTGVGAVDKSFEIQHEEQLRAAKYAQQQKLAAERARAYGTEANPAQTTFSSERRYAPSYHGEPVAGYEPAPQGGPGAVPRNQGRQVVWEKPYYTEAHTHASTRGVVNAANDVSQFEALFGKQTEADLEHATKDASPLLTGAVNAIGGALPGVGLAKAAEHGTLTGKSVLGEVANDLLWLGPGEIAAPFKITKGILTAARSGEDIGKAAKAAVELWKTKRLARIQNPILARDIAGSPDRQSFVAALHEVPKLSGTEQHALLQVADHNAIVRSAATGEKPSIAWGKANFGKSTFHDLNPTAEEARAAIGGDAKFQKQPLTSFPAQSTWDNPQALKRSERDATMTVDMPVGHYPDVHVRVPFVSKLHALVFDMPPKAGVNELLGKMKSAGIKQDEIKWNKFDTFLATATAKGQKSITREEALSWLDKNYLQLEENRRFTQAARNGDRGNANADETIFGQYTIPGGKEAHYQEFTIRLPQDQYGDLYRYTEHYPDANILAHIRTTDREVAGDHTLMIEEIQSDWHQAGQKSGYAIPVTEHPEYETTAMRAEQAGKDLNSIASTLRRRITDGLQSHPSLAAMPEQLVQAFERTAEESLGIDASSRTSVDDAKRWMARLQQAQDDLPNAELSIEIVPHESAAPDFTYHHYQLQLAADGKLIGGGADANFGTFSQNYGQELGPVERMAERQAMHLNNFLQMRGGDRSAVELGVQALYSAHSEHISAREAMSHLEATTQRGIAQGPFAKTWHELAFKRMLAEAVDKGYSRIAWTTGKTQAERYDLANFFNRIEINGVGGSSVNYDRLREWAEEMARSSVDDMSNEDLGITDHIEEELRQEAYGSVDFPREEDFYVTEDANGNTSPAHPDDSGAILDQNEYDSAYEDALNEADQEYDRLLENTIDSYRHDAIEGETDYYMENAGEHDGPSSGNLTVHATASNGGTHEYAASTDPNDENYLANVVGPDVAQQHLEHGQTVFESKDLVAGEKAKSALGAARFYDNKLTGFVNKYLKSTGVQTSAEEIGGEVAPKKYLIEDAQYRPGGSSPGHRFVVTAENGVIVATTDTREEAQSLVSTFAEQDARKRVEGAGTVVHSIPVTDAVRKFTDQGLVLFQEDPLVKQIAQARVKGAVRIAPGDKADLHLFAAADVSTVVHEIGHAVQDAIPAMRSLDPEEFARSFERYFMTAKGPTENLVLPFADISEGMRAVYGSPLKVPGAKLTPKMKAALDSFFAAAERDHPDILRALTRIRFQPVSGEPGATPTDPMLEAAAMQVDAGTPLEKAAEMYRVDPVSLKAHMQDGGHAVEQQRILSNGDVGTGTAAEVDARHDELRQQRGDTRFQEGPPEPIGEPSGTQEPAPEPTPEETLRRGMKGVPIRRSAQNAIRHEERARRAQAFNAALQRGEGIAGYRKALNELGGELPKIDYGGFKELTPEALDHLVNVVRDHPHLMPYQKARLIEALDKATRGTLVTPSEQVLIEHVFGKETARGLKDISGLPSHIQNLLAEVLNVPRSVMASFDLSAPFRQGLVIGVTHPVIFARNFPVMLKSFGSERVYQAVMDEVKARPTFPLMHSGGLAITDMEDITRREEQFYSNFAEKLSGGWKREEGVGRFRSGARHLTPERSPIRMSGRAYSAFLVKTRADVFDHLLRVDESLGHIRTPHEYEKFLHDLSRFINAATGRGNLGTLQGAAPFLNTIFFSPRLLASRVDLLFSPITYARADPFVRRQALQATLSLAGAAATVLGLVSNLPGVTVNLDPRNADFAKIKIGHDTRLDILGGFQQPFRLISQFVSGKIISSTTGDALVLGPQGPGAVSRRDIVQRFFEGKLAPVPSIINDWMKKQNFQGQKFKWSQEAYQHMIPLTASDAASIYHDVHGGVNGIALALAGYVPDLFGIGVQTYGPKNPAQKPTTRLNAEAKKAGMAGPTPTLLIDVKHQANLDSLSQKEKNNPQGRLDAFLKYYAQETGDHQFDKWIGKKLSDDAAEAGAESIRHALVGPGLHQYEAAIRASLKAQGKKW